MKSDNTRVDMEDAAARYIAQGYRLVRLKPGSKQPVSAKGWQNAEPTADQFGPHDNLGVQLGPKSGHLVDLDFDIPQARALAGLDCFFGDLPAFRRASLSPDSPGHRLVICRDAPDKVVQFGFTREAEKVATDRLPKSMVLEIRAGRCFTVFPPSRIGDDQLVFDARADRSIPEMTWEQLRVGAGLLAFVAFAAAFYPDEGGRDWFCFHLAGVLVHLGLDAEVVDEIVVAVAELNGDFDPTRRGKGRAAAEKVAAGEPVTGLPKLLEFIGMEGCEKRVRSWLQWDDNPEGEVEPIPDDAIQVGRPDVHNLVHEVETLLIEKSGRVFRRHAELVRVSQLEEAGQENGVYRHAGLTELRTASPGWLAIEASRVGTFVSRQAKRLVPVAPPDALMAKLHSVADESRFAPINGLSMTPTLTCERPGYDPDSRLFLAFPDDMFPPAPMQPTREQAEEALARLAMPLRGFPFVDDAARAVALSGMVSGVIRGELRTCPLHCIDAPAAGTGKTKLAEIIGIMGTGVPPSGVTHSTENEENEKRLVSILRTGDPIVLIDNVSADLEGDFLCAMLTNETVQARILGQSERVRLGTRVLMLATGNNVRLRGDMTRRAVTCRLDAKMMNPDERRFDFDAVEEVRATRPQLVVDALTVVRAYIAAGRPTDLPAFGSFEDWSLVRGTLVWLGEADPAGSRAGVKNDNPEVEEKVELLQALLTHVDVGRRFTMREVDATHGLEPLRDTVARMLPRGDWDKRRAGILLRRHKDVPFMGVTLRSTPNRVGVQEWWVEGRPDEALMAARDQEIELPF